MNLADCPHVLPMSPRREQRHDRLLGWIGSELVGTEWSEPQQCLILTDQRRFGQRGEPVDDRGVSARCCEVVERGPHRRILPDSLSLASPGITQLVIDELSVLFPGGVFGASEQLRDLGPGKPLSGMGRDKACTRSTGDSDRDLFAGLDASDKAGGILAQFAKADILHEPMVALVLPGRLGSQRGVGGDRTRPELPPFEIMDGRGPVASGPVTELLSPVGGPCCLPKSRSQAGCRTTSRAPQLWP